MMGWVLTITFLFCNLLLLLAPSLSHPLCTDSRAPFTLKTPLTFCPYNGSVCCNSTKDLELKQQLQAMNISQQGCASLLKSILCSRCDQFSAQLFRGDPISQPVPVLCNSTTSPLNTSQSSSTRNGFCSDVWDTCQNVSIVNSPFATSLEGQSGVKVGSNSTKLTELWQSKTDFCNAFGGSSSDGSLCFDGGPVVLNKTGTPTPPSGLCLEKIGNGSYLNMVGHPDGSNRAFFSDQPGNIWLATVPKEGAGELGLDEANPFLDLTDEVHFDAEFGMMGVAFHPNFARNGRFFASFNCDKIKWPRCTGRCSCNSDANCDPSKLQSDDNASPCRYQAVIAEFTANSSSSQPSSATVANPSEVRRIFTMGLPFTSHHAGQILFGPDGYLYFMMGDGGGSGDPYNFAQNKKSVLGKIMRLDIDNIPSAAEISNLGLWGNYSIPEDNPFAEDKELLPEIWAMGLRNPWRCSFDSERPSYLMCGDTGQDEYEEVDIITKDGNFGWRVYEGPNLYTPQQSPGGNTSANSINAIFPVMGYYHDINNNQGSASVTGGYFYRSMTDPCMYGWYLFGDLYAHAIWAGTENPENSGNFTMSQVPFSCAHDSPIPCNSVPGSSLPALGYIFSFGEDNNKDVFILTSSGVYRVVRPSRCNYSCSKENATAASSPSAAPTSLSSQASWPNDLSSNFLLLFLSLLCLVLFPV